MHIVWDFTVTVNAKYHNVQRFCGYSAYIDMGIHGHIESAPNIAKAKFDGDRIRLPARFVRSIELQKQASVDCWLLVVTPGRYRLVPQALAREDSSGIVRLLREIKDIESEGDVLDGTDSNGRAALVTRLIPTVAYQDDKKNWRITFPAEARMLLPQGEDQRFVFLTLSAGFIDLWFPETLRRAISVPISGLLES